MNLKKSEAICGIWTDPGGEARLWIRDDAGNAREAACAFDPYLWASGVPDALDDDACAATPLAGAGPLNHLLRFSDRDAYFGLIKDRGQPLDIEYIRVLDNQFLLENQLRLYGDLPLAGLRRLQLDIETDCEVAGGFSDPARQGDRVLAIGLRLDDQVEILELPEPTDAAERELLKRFGEILRAWDPDIIEGHNLFNFDLMYLARRSRRFKLPLDWGRFGQKASTRNSRIRIAERMVDFIRCDIPGRAVFDTYLMIQVFDVGARDLPSYRLKDVARYLGVTPDHGGDRTYLAGDAIGETFRSDREAFRAYLGDDLRETAGIAEILLPTYVAQAKSFPITLQEACLRGTANKVDLLFMEKYFHAGHSLPDAAAAPRAFEGGYTKSFETGVFHHVLHFDVASLYPSLLLLIGRNPAADELGVFIPMLQELKAYRLKYKELARTAQDPALRREYHARQASFKILINSFYGYLGFPGARFGDGELAAEVTARGRELLKALIARFQEVGCTVLEADTDGIYLSSEDHYERPEDLLEQVNPVLPEGIDLEFDGRYRAMFCYKAKNYALFDGEKITIRGSALRSRGTEPFLKDLTWHLIAALLGAEQRPIEDRLAETEQAIEDRSIPVDQLAKAEYLSMSPEAYRKKIENGGKPRRAALEVALQSEKPLKTGDQVAYYILPREKGQTSDWQRARAREAYDPESAPYDPKYYLKKIKDWKKRYRDFL